MSFPTRRPYRYDIRLSHRAADVLDRYGHEFGMSWALAETALLQGERSPTVAPDWVFTPNGRRLHLRSGVVFAQRDTGILAKTLDRELDGFARRRAQAAPMGVPAGGLTEVDVVLPVPILRLLRIRAFAAGRSVFDEMRLRFDIAAKNEALWLRGLDGDTSEMPVRVPARNLADLARCGRTIGARAVPMATRSAVYRLVAEEVPK